MKATDYFNLNLTQGQLDFVNIDLVSDSELYLNSNMISNSSFKNLKLNGAKDIASFFENIFNLYKSGERDKTIDSFFNHSSEDNSNHFGLSAKKSQGKGLSRDELIVLFDKLYATGILSSQYISNPESILILAPGFGPDFMSDLLLSILRKRLVDYSLFQAKKLNIPIEKDIISYGDYWNSSSLQWEELCNRWIKGPDGNPVILTPKQIVSEEYAYSTGDYIQKFVLTWRQSYHLDNRTTLVDTKSDKNGNMVYKKPSKQKIRKYEIDEKFSDNKNKSYASLMTNENPNLFKQYIDQHSKNSKVIKDHILSDSDLERITTKHTNILI